MVTKYIIMCGGDYSKYWDKPRQLVKVNGEVLVERTIRLLKENGINDISISSNYDEFKYLNVPLLKHNNSYRTEGNEVLGYWCDAFYPTDEPTCYIFGDVYFSEEAIKTIVNTDTDDIEFFGSAPPFSKNYPKNHVEPFALKVVNTKHLKEAIEKTKKLEDEGKFWRKPIMWELWTVIKNVPLQKGPDDFIYNYVAINDYTSDIDRTWDIDKLEYIIGGLNMIKVKAIEKFTLKDFSKLRNIKRNKLDIKGTLFVGDEFECDKEMADYLLGNNPLNKQVIELVEITPEKSEEKPEGKQEEKLEEKPEKEIKNKTVAKKSKKKKK